MDKFKQGLRDMADTHQHGAEETQDKGQQAADAAKEKTQGRPGQNLKSAVEDKTQNLREEGERFMQGGGCYK